MSPHPKPLQVEIQALVTDAGKWHGTAHVMSDAKTKVDSEAYLSATSFGFLGANEGTDKAFTAVNSFLSQMAGQGYTELQYGGDSLLRVAKVYQGAEDTSKQAIENGWHM